jgi:hypothetical protein
MYCVIRLLQRVCSRPLEGFFINRSVKLPHKERQSLRGLGEMNSLVLSLFHSSSDVRLALQEEPTAHPPEPIAVGGLLLILALSGACLIGIAVLFWVLRCRKRSISDSDSK